MQRTTPQPRVITSFGSRGVTLRPVERTDDVQVVLIDLEPGGVLARHPAVGPQTLAVVSGEGWSAGGDGVPHRLTAGDLVRFAPGEEHETGSDTGMRVVVVETPTPAG